jgi:hypothetical protein
MHKRFLFLLVVAISSPSAPLKAQRSFDNAFQKGIVLLDLHTSLGIYRNADKNFLSTRLPLFIGADYGLSDKISGGIFGGWNQRSYKPAGQPIYDVNYYYYGVRFNVHLTEILEKRTPLKFDPSRVDIYAGLWAGRQDARTLVFSGSGFVPAGTVNLAGAIVGVRLYTIYRVSVLVEAGIGPYGVLNIGIATRL